jgi:kinesin family protein 1
MQDYADFGVQLEQYYSVHSPSKIGTVHRIIKRWKGKEGELIAGLELKYGEKFGMGTGVPDEVDDSPPSPPQPGDYDDSNMGIDLDSPLSVAWKDIDLDAPLSDLSAASLSDLSAWSTATMPEVEIQPPPRPTKMSKEIEIPDAHDTPVHPGSGEHEELAHCWRSVKADLRSGGNQQNNVQVAVRARPLNSRELKLGSKVAVKITATTTVTEGSGSSNHGQIKLDNSGEGLGRQVVPRVFGFDYCFDSMQPDLTKAGGSTSFASQRSVFEKLGYRLLANCWAGYNVSLLCYGQTGSGKSYSMQGSESMAGDDAGILPRITRHLFYQIEQRRMEEKERTQTSHGVDTAADDGSDDGRDDGRDFMVQAAYVEIFNEKIRDLLNPDGINLRIREHPHTGVYVEDLLAVEVSNYDDVHSLMQDGTQARAVASTNMNAASSRSHAIFTITFTQTSLMKSPGSDETISFSKVSKVNMIDLAGSEDQRSSGSKGARLKEAGCINKSLSALGKCISQLAAAAGSDAKAANESDISSSSSTGPPKHKRSVSAPIVTGSTSPSSTSPSSTSPSSSSSGKGFIPYRDSKLTWLLCESLGGNAHTIMLATISPADCNYEETLSTLR